MPFVIDTIQAGTIDVSQAITVNGQTVGGLPYKVYTASLTQVEEENPTAVVFENTLGFEVNWIRTGLGVYTLSLPIGTDITKIFILLGINNKNTDNVFVNDKEGKQTITISTTGRDGNLGNSGIEIRIYP